jgi:hypothetical protein
LQFTLNELDKLLSEFYLRISPITVNAENLDPKEYHARFLEISRRFSMMRIEIQRSSILWLRINNPNKKPGDYWHQLKKNLDQGKYRISSERFIRRC